MLHAPKHPGARLGHTGEGALAQSWSLSSLQVAPPHAPLQSYELILHKGTHRVLQRGPGGDLPYRVRYMGVYLTVETHSGVVVSWDRKTSVIIRLRHEYKVGAAGRGPPGGTELSRLEQAQQWGLAVDGLLRAGVGEGAGTRPVPKGPCQSWGEGAPGSLVPAPSHSMPTGLRLCGRGRHLPTAGARVPLPS